MDGDLGKFGYGLKGAAWSQADRLTVVSKAAGAKSTTLTWDKDHLAKTRRWALLSDPVAPEHAASVKIGESGTAVLLVEQDVDAALTVAERAYVMETGRVVMSGTAGELLADPRIQQSYLGIA